MKNHMRCKINITKSNILKNLRILYTQRLKHQNLQILLQEFLLFFPTLMHGLLM